MSVLDYMAASCAPSKPGEAKAELTKTFLIDKALIYLFLEAFSLPESPCAICHMTLPH